VSEIQPVRNESDNVRCRFSMTAADARSSYEFCVFEFPACKGCPRAIHVVGAVGSSENPMKSMAWSNWIASVARPKSSCA
jgi:hypothetical protein